MPQLIVEFIFFMWLRFISSIHIPAISSFEMFFFLFFCFILGRTNPVSMCESHSRPPGLCLFTPSPSHEWFVKSCITIMTHCCHFFWKTD